MGLMQTPSSFSALFWATGGVWACEGCHGAKPGCCPVGVDIAKAGSSQCLSWRLSEVEQFQDYDCQNRRCMEQVWSGRSISDQGTIIAVATILASNSRGFYAWNDALKSTVKINEVRFREWNYKYHHEFCSAVKDEVSRNCRSVLRCCRDVEWFCWLKLCKEPIIDAGRASTLVQLLARNLTKVLASGFKKFRIRLPKGYLKNRTDNTPSQKSSSSLRAG